MLHTFAVAVVISVIAAGGVLSLWTLALDSERLGPPRT